MGEIFEKVLIFFNTIPQLPVKTRPVIDHECSAYVHMKAHIKTFIT